MAKEKKLTKFEKNIKDCKSTIAFIKKYGLNQSDDKDIKIGQKNILINYRGFIGNPHKSKDESLKDWEKFVAEKLKELGDIPFL